MRDNSEDIIYEILKYSSGSNILYFANIENCTIHGINAFAMTEDSKSPYIKTLMDYKTGVCKTYSGSYLEWVHNNIIPKNMADLIGIKKPYFKNFENL